MSDELSNLSYHEKLDWFVNGEWRDELSETDVSDDVDELFRVIDGE